AEQHRLVDQVARLFGFKASVAKEEGRLLEERDLRLRAVEAWSGVGGSAQRARALSELIWFFGGVGCWVAVSDQIQRSELCLSKLTRASRDADREVYDVAIEIFRAEALLQEERAQEAWQVLDALDRAKIKTRMQGLVPKYLDDLAWAAEATGREHEARQILADGIGFALYRDPLPTTIPLLSRAGRLLAHAGEADSARRLLATYWPRLSSAKGITPALRVEYLAAWSQAEAAAGDRAAARDRLGRALDAAWSGAHETDAGAESYLALADPPGLREAMLGQASTPSASYQ